MQDTSKAWERDPPRDPTRQRWTNYKVGKYDWRGEQRHGVNKAFVPASSLDTEIKSFRSARAGRPVPALCKSTTRCSALMYRDISISSSGYGDEVATVANNFCALPLCYLCSPPSCAWLQKGISGFSGKTGSAAVFFQKKRRDVFERIETR